MGSPVYAAWVYEDDGSCCHGVVRCSRGHDEVGPAPPPQIRRVEGVIAAQGAGVAAVWMGPPYCS